MTDTAVSIARSHPPTVPWWSNAVPSKEVKIPTFISQTSMLKEKHGQSYVVIAWSLDDGKYPCKILKSDFSPQHKKDAWRSNPSPALTVCCDVDGSGRIETTRPWRPERWFPMARYNGNEKTKLLGLYVCTQHSVTCSIPCSQNILT